MEKIAKMRLLRSQILSSVMKKFIFIFVCAILGSCAIVGCNGNSAAQSEQNDSIAIDSIEVVDSISADSVICSE